MRSTAEITSAQPATANSTEGQPQDVGEPEPGDGDAPDDDGDDHGPAPVVDAVHPAGGQRADQRADPRGREQVADDVGPPWKTVSARAGNRARGMPKTMALMSMR